MPTNGGLKMKYEMIDCYECEGQGFVPIQFSMMADGICDVCRGTRKVKSDYIIIDDPVEAVLFLNRKGTFVHFKDLEGKYEVVISTFGLSYLIRKIGYFKIHKSVVREVCKAVEGYPVLRFKDTGFIFYEPVYDGIMAEDIGYIKANALTIGKSVAELKELIKWYKE